ncbi:HesA/MoeB/ThiF family protein [Chryseobacterium sp. CT-SW4]|uniref:HesA/MoeB/ThiF family protein n=1 Tax=Chryseobacterium sp. SW-1 TaxID=3157343 RepID=UPI003B0243C9
MKPKDYFARYSRQVFIDEVGLEGQRKIRDAQVLIVGAGGLGSPVIQYLASAGVGLLGIADFDVVELHNLNRQVIHTEKTVGVSKVKSAVQFVKAINTDVKVEEIEKKLTESNAKEILAPYDIIVDCSDNFTTRYLINDQCVDLEKPLIYGSIQGFSGQVAIFNFKGSKDLRAIFPDPPLEEDIPDCDSLGVLGSLPGIVGSMMAHHTLKIILGLPVPLNQLTLIDTRDWRFQTLEL